MGIEPTDHMVDMRPNGFEDRGRHQPYKHFLVLSRTTNLKGLEANSTDSTFDPTNKDFTDSHTGHLATKRSGLSLETL